MKKISVAMLANSLSMNGISSVIMNYCTRIDKNIFDVTILAGPLIAQHNKQECEKHGVTIVELPPRKASPAKYYSALFKQLKKNKYDIVHVHGNSATMTIELFLAKLAGVKHRIAHCHNSTCEQVRLHNMLKGFFKHMYTKAYACSSLAGEWIFGRDNFEIVTNAFVIDKYKFDENLRKSIRGKYHIPEDAFVIGNVARINHQKNHPYLLKVFEKVAQKDKQAWLLIAGDGPDSETLNNLIDEHPYKERIIYLGEVSNANQLYNAFDLFVLPTRHEGLGIVFIEAQINGMKVVTSTEVPTDVNLCGDVKMLSLKDGHEGWAECILSIKDDCQKHRTTSKSMEVFEKYNIDNATVILQDNYKKMMKNA